jgi:hypothetical protein
MELTFDRAIELLEVSDISKIDLTNLSAIEKRAKRRWHPDIIARKKDDQLTDQYTRNFQLIEPAIHLLRQYLTGDFHAGKASSVQEETFTDPVEVIRENAERMQIFLQNIWHKVKAEKFAHRVEKVLISDGFSLKDLLKQDFEDDIAGLSLVSFVYTSFLMLIIMLILSFFAPPLILTLGGIFWGLAALSCFFGFLPLSRFWLPRAAERVMLWFINFGLSIYRWAEDEAMISNWFIKLIVALPMFLAYLIKYLVLFPIFEIAKLFVGNKRVGIVEQEVNYYADLAEWYIEELLDKTVHEMSEEELFHLSHLYSMVQRFK